MPVIFVFFCGRVRVWEVEEFDRLLQAVMKVSRSMDATKMHVQDVDIFIVAQTVCMEIHHV